MTVWGRHRIPTDVFLKFSFSEPHQEQQPRAVRPAVPAGHPGRRGDCPAGVVVLPQPRGAPAGAHMHPAVLPSAHAHVLPRPGAHVRHYHHDGPAVHPISHSIHRHSLWDSLDCQRFERISSQVEKESRIIDAAGGGGRGGGKNPPG